MNLVEKDFISFVNGKCKFGDSNEYWRHGVLSAKVTKVLDRGYVVLVSDESIEVALASERKDFRTFASIDSAGKFLRSAGFKSFQVCMA
jgi:hypothetical protein